MNELREYIEACKNNMNYLAPGRVERYLDLEVARVRQAALEEAAKVAADLYMGQPGHTAKHWVGVYRADVAEAIRALIPHRKENDEGR